MNREEKHLLSATGIVILFLVILFCLIPMMSHAGTYYLRWEVPDYDAWAAYDSLRVIAYDANTPNTPACSLNTGSFPFVDSLGPLDSTKAYVVWEFRGYADFDSLAPMSALHISPIEVSASATVDYGEMNDTLSAHHGSGSWTPSGTGAASVRFFVYSTAGDSSTPVPGVQVSVKNRAQTLEHGRGGTSTDSGLVTLNVPEDTVVVIADLTGWTFPTFDTTVMVGDSTYYIYGTWFTPDAPSDSNSCTVYGYLARSTGDPTYANRLITFTLPKMVTNSCNGQDIIDLMETAITDSVGYYEQELAWSSCIGDLEYTISYGQGKTKKITVPDSTSYQVVWDD